MKKFALFCWLTILAMSLVSCQSADGKIRPGDKIGGMTFTSNFSDCHAPNINEICTFDSLFDGTCKIPVDVTKMWISSGWMEGSWEDLNLAWKDSQWRMTFDDHPVDLSAFGTNDIDWQVSQNSLWDVCKQTYKEVHNDQEKARMWNVCISNPSPGKHTVRYEFYMKNGMWRGDHVETFVFTVLSIASK